jgi:serine protease Do
MLLCWSVSYAEAVKDREGAVRADKARMENDPRWIYQDVEKGFEEARKSGKPLMVVLRCVPCLSCMGIDSTVLEEGDLAPLLDNFIRVRIINANTLDLTKFQMDTDLSFSTMFFNGDGTVYGRFGSWMHQKNSKETDTSSFKAALESTLALHAGYPANKAQLKGKQPGETPFKSAIEIPMLAAKYKTVLDWEGKVVGSCVHCHMIGDAYRTWYRDAKKPIPEEWLFPFPSPETVGLTLDPRTAGTIQSVKPDSAAAKAGLKSGDVIRSLNGQPLISGADVSWALHRTTGAGKLDVELASGSASMELAADWKEGTDSSQRAGAWPMRGMATGGLVLIALDEETRKARGLSADKLGLFVKGVGMFGKHAAAKRAGFQKDDIVVEVDGQSAAMTESQLHAYLLRNHFPGEQVEVKVLRGQETKMLKLPMQ